MAQYPVKRGETVSLHIESLAMGGRGVARIDGYTLFVERGLPGQVVEATVFRRKRSYGEARIERILEPSPCQVDARCAHFGVCGGCAIQHLAYEAQLEEKTRQVHDCLTRLGGLSQIQVEPTLPSPRSFGYRNKMEFSFGTRWLEADEMDQAGEIDDRFGLGLHVRKRFDRVVNIQECHIHTRAGSEVLRRVRALAAEGGFPIYSTRNHQGFWRFLVVREGANTGDRMVYLVTARAPEGSAERTEVDRVFNALLSLEPKITSLLHGTSSRKAAVAVSDDVRTVAGRPVIEDRILDLVYEIGPHTFFQTNTLGAERLFQTALDRLAPSPSDTVWDLYCGVGALSLPLARRSRSVTGIELVPEAIDTAKRNAEKNGIRNTRFLAGDVRTFLNQSTAEPKPEIIVVNPPREGLHPAVVQGILKTESARVLYVSCNPATLARDLGIFAAGGYQSQGVQPVDMFPHTPHVECVTVLKRSS